MAIVNPFILSNKNGIPRVESISVSINTTDVTFNFRNHQYLNLNYEGIILFKINQEIPTGTTNTLPIKFSTDGKSVNFKSYNNENITVSSFNGTGIYLAYYSSDSGLLQIL